MGDTKQDWTPPRGRNQMTDHASGYAVVSDRGEGSRLRWAWRVAGPTIPGMGFGSTDHGREATLEEAQAAAAERVNQWWPKWREVDHG